MTPSLGPVDTAGLQLSVQHREISNGDVYFLFNESYEFRIDTIRIKGAFTEAVLFDAKPGQPIVTEINGDTTTVTLAGARGVLLRVTRPK